MHSVLKPVLYLCKPTALQRQNEKSCLLRKTRWDMKKGLTWAQPKSEKYSKSDKLEEEQKPNA